MSEKQNGFSMSYNPEHKSEITKIKEKYQSTPAEKTDMEKLKELDRKAEMPGQVVSLVIGVIGTLIFGTGMSLVLVSNYIIPGVILGLVGAAIMIPAYPVYKVLTKSSREKIAPQVLELVEKMTDSPS